MKKNEYEVTIQVNGKNVREYQKDDLVFVQGNEGSHYQIKIKNNSWQRVLAVVYVDGHSVMSDTNDDSGYVINGHSTVVIKGFRTSEETEAQFVFSRKGDSRAQKVKGNAANAGVIGVRIYKEKQQYIFNEQQTPWVNPLPTLQDWYYTGTPYNTSTSTGSINTNYTTSSNSIDSVASTTNYSCSVGEVPAKSNFDLGTEMGADVSSRITMTSFERGGLYTEFAIHYTSRKQLQKMGINLNNEKQAFIPSAFGGFCRRPK